MKPKKKLIIIAGIVVVALLIIGFALRYKDEIFSNASVNSDKPNSTPISPEISTESETKTIDAEDALNLLNDALADEETDIGEIELTLYYDEPESVLNQDYSEYVDAWIFFGSDTFFYAVTLDDGQLYKYDMVNGALMGIDEAFAD